MRGNLRICLGLSHHSCHLCRPEEIAVPVSSKFLFQNWKHFYSSQKGQSRKTLRAAQALWPKRVPKATRNHSSSVERGSYDQAIRSMGAWGRRNRPGLLIVGSFWNGLRLVGKLKQLEVWYGVNGERLQTTMEILDEIPCLLRSFLSEAIYYKPNYLDR